MRVAWVILIAGCGFQAQPVGGQTGAPPDAAAFDFASCPPTYSADLPGPSRYRLIPEGRPAWTHSDDCADDMPGATHLVVLETLDETMRVAMLVNAPPVVLAGNSVWVGTVQQVPATAPNQGWIWFDGQPLTMGWHNGEPNDRGAIEDRQEQFVKLEKNRTYFTDSSGTDSYGALCECDGAPIAQTARDAIAANRR